MATALVGYRLNHRHDTIGDAEADVATSKGHAVEALRVVVVAGTRVLSQHLAQGSLLIGREEGGDVGRDDDVEGLPDMGVDETAAGIGMGIGIGHVWLDVVDGRAVHQVGTENVDDGTEVGRQLHLIYIYARES